jgi:glutamyl-tRNA synthetase
MHVRTRIAPSPTGIAHIGTAYYAIYNYAIAKQHGGEFVVRIEDTDRSRFIEGAEQAIFDALSWLGIPHDEGPDIGGPYIPYRQSERLDIYKKYAEQLIEQGDAYYCFCTPETLDEMRKEQQARKELPRYDRRCRALVLSDVKKRVSSGDRHVIRMKVPDNEKIGWEDFVRGYVEFDSSSIDDQVLIKSDGFPTYHLAVVVDDYLMKISHVMRGEEWISSAPKHILLYRFFGWELPHFAHMPLLRNNDKSKMSKRKNDVSIFSYKDKGFLPEALVNYLCLMGWSHPEGKDIFSYDEYVKTFSIDRIQTTGPVFDIAKLTWMNQQYIMQLSNEDLKKRLVDYDASLVDLGNQLLDSLLPLVKERMTTLRDFWTLAGHFLNEPAIATRSNTEKEIAQTLRVALTDLKDWHKDALLAVFKDVMGKYNVRMPVLYYLLTGSERGLPLPESIELLGKDRTLKRLSFLNIA